MPHDSDCYLLHFVHANNKDFRIFPMTLISRLTAIYYTFGNGNRGEIKNRLYLSLDRAYSQTLLFTALCDYHLIATGNYKNEKIIAATLNRRHT